MFIVHVMVLPSDISEGCFTHITFVHSFRVLAAKMVSKRFWSAEPLFTDVAAVGYLLTDSSITPGVTVQLLVFF